MTDFSSGFDLNAQYPGYIDRLFHIESGGDPNAVTGSNRGLGQFGRAEEARYGITDANRSSYDAQAAAVTREAAEHASALQKSLGRPPTAGELYLTHQQGIAGGPALLTANSDQPAWMAIRPYYRSDAVAKQAISGNIPSNHPLYRSDVNGISAGDFRNLWVNKFENAPTTARAPSSGSVSMYRGSAQPAGNSLLSQHGNLGDAVALTGGAAPVPSVGGSSAVPDASAASPSLTQDQANTLGRMFEETPLQPAPQMQLASNQARLRNVLAGKMGANPNALQLPPSVKERIAALMGRIRG